MDDDNNQKDDVQLKGLCMKCRQKGKDHQMQVMKNVTVSEKNNRYSAKGTCVTCGTNMFKFLSKDDAQKMM